MKKKVSIGGYLAAALLAAAVAIPAFAQSTGAPGVSGAGNGDGRFRSRAAANEARVAARADARQAARTAAVQKRDKNLTERADREIDRRTAILTRLSARIQEMAKVSDSDKTLLFQNVQAQISDLASLKSKIASDTGTTTLRDDVKSIVDSYRTYILVVPQAEILAAADRLSSIIGNFTIVGTKLQSRIAAVSNAGKDVSALSSAMSDFNAKIADAAAQADAAKHNVSGLVPDQGDKTIRASNQAALKQAHADLRVGMRDLVAARKDAGTIVKALRGIHLGNGEMRSNADQSASGSSTAPSGGR